MRALLQLHWEIKLAQTLGEQLSVINSLLNILEFLRQRRQFWVRRNRGGRRGIRVGQGLGHQLTRGRLLGRGQRSPELFQLFSPNVDGGSSTRLGGAQLLLGIQCRVGATNPNQVRELLELPDAGQRGGQLAAALTQYRHNR